MIKWEDSEISLESGDVDAQLYDRSVERYALLDIQGIPSPYEFSEVYGDFRSHLYEANRMLFKLDSLAETKFKNQLKSPEFDKMREALDKCAERLQWATERGRKMNYFLGKLLKE